MLKTHGSMSRAVVTRRALGQIRQLNMVKLKRMLTVLVKEEVIEINKAPRNGKPGIKAEIVSLTEFADEWLKDNK